MDFRHSTSETVRLLSQLQQREAKGGSWLRMGRISPLTILHEKQNGSVCRFTGGHCLEEQERSMLFYMLFLILFFSHEGRLIIDADLKLYGAGCRWGCRN
jgi:hypothetical protein